MPNSVSSVTSLLSTRSEPPTKKKVNFIQVNKNLVSKKPNESVSSDNVVIRCLNDVERHLKTSASSSLSSNKPPQQKAKLNNSNSSATSSSSYKPLPASLTTTTTKMTTNSSKNAIHTNDSTPEDLEISIISNHSSIATSVVINDDKRRQLTVTVGDDATKKVDGDDVVLASNGSINKNNNLDAYYESNSNLRGVLSKSNEKLYDILRDEKLPSTGSSNSSSSASFADKIEPLKNDENDFDEDSLSRQSQDYAATINQYRPISIVKHHSNLPNFIEAVNEKGDQQPHLAKMQADLDSKLNHVLNRLESIEKKDEVLVNKLAQQNYLKQELESIEAQRVHDVDKIESETKLKYIEQIQEKQFQLISQLISALNKENQNASMTLEDGKENLRNMKRQFNISEPVFMNCCVGDCDARNYMNPPSQPAPSQMPMATCCSHVVTTCKDRISRQNQATSKKTASKSRSKSNIRPETVKSRSRSTASNRIITHHQRSPSRSSERSRCSLKLQKSRSKSPFNRSNHSCDESPTKRKPKKQFLQDLLDKNKSPNASSIGLRNSIDLNETTQPLLFDKFLKKPKSLMPLARTSMDSLSTNLLSQKKNSRSNASLNNESSFQQLKQAPPQPPPSMFSDIKEVLKVIEQSKTKIESDIKELERERENKMFYLMSTITNDKSDYVRMEKLVDGCVSAISNDVQKVVSQKLIDESRHVKLEAENDLPYSKKKTTQSNKVLGFGSTTVRSSAVNDKKKEPSNTFKYLGKVYGKSLIDEIKAEEMKEKFSLRDKNSATREKSHLLRNLSNKGELNKKSTKQQTNQIKSSVSASNLQNNIRPAFITSQYIPYPENEMRAFRTSNPNFELEQTNTKSNVGYVEINKNKKSTITKQNLPPVNINPKSEATKANLNETQLINKTDLDDQDDDGNDFSVNQNGTGIQLPGYKKPPQVIPSQSVLNKKSSLRKSTDLSNETAEFVRLRQSIESKVFSWMEQELVDKILEKLGFQVDENQPDESQIVEGQKEKTYEDDFEDENRTNLIDTTNDKLINFVGQQGFKIFVDVGQPVDPDLIEALTREVLEEKISSLINDKEEYPTEPSFPRQSQLISEQEAVKPKPQILPARKTIEFLEKLNLAEQQIGIEVQTPIPTPHESPSQTPVPTPRGKTISNPQVTFEEKKQPQPAVRIYQPPIIQPQYICLVKKDDKSDSSVCEESQEHEDFDNYNQQQSGLQQSQKHSQEILDPVATPEPSEEEVIKPAPRNLKSTSVQCDPEPKKDSIVVIQPKPVQTEPPKQSIRQQTLNKNRLESINITAIQETRLSESSESSTLSTSSTSSTLTSNDDDEADEAIEDSYMSDGAWLISKSEGQIIPYEEKVNAMGAFDSNQIKGNRRPSDTLASQSEGEISLNAKGILNRVNSNEDSITDSKNVARRGSEGEVDIYKMKVYNNNKSHSGLKQQQQQQQKASLNKSPTPTLRRGSTSPTKTQVDLTISAKKAVKNNIRIQPIPNEVTVKDSNEFERKIFSSTPDTSVYVPENKNELMASTNTELNELDILDQYENYVQEQEALSRPNQSNQSNQVRTSENLELGEEESDADLREYQVNLEKEEDEEDDTINNSTDIENK